MQKKALRTLFLYNGIFVLAGNLFVPLYSVYVQQLRNNMFTITVSWATFLIASTLFSLLISYFSTKLPNKEYLLTGGYLLRAFTWGSFVFVDSIASLLALQVMLGLGEALGSPAFDALMADKVSEGSKLAEYSTWKSVCNLMTAIGAIVGGSIVAYGGFTPLFISMAILSLVSFVGVYFSDLIPTKAKSSLLSLAMNDGKREKVFNA